MYLSSHHTTSKFGVLKIVRFQWVDIKPLNFLLGVQHLLDNAAMHHHPMQAGVRRMTVVVQDLKKNIWILTL